MKKTKVFIAAASLKIGGAEKVARDIASYAAPDMFEFHYLVFGEEIGAYEAQLQKQGYKVFHFAEPSQSHWMFFRVLIRLLRENDYYAVHAHNMFNCGFTMLAAALMGVPVRISHAHSALDDGRSLVKSAYEAVMRFLILTCSTDLVACGVKAGERLFGKRAFRKRGQLILNGIDAAAFAYSEECREAVRMQHGLQSRFVLGHAGHLAQVKNQSFLLDLMPLILEKRPDTMLLLLGEGEDRPMLERKIQELHLEGHVILTGNVSNVSDYLSAMDVFVFPSLFEGLPLSILEVQANGLPCVISDRVPEDVFLTELLRPLSLEAPKRQWVDAILNARRAEALKYNRQLRDSEYTVEKAMEKIYRLYQK